MTKTQTQHTQAPWHVDDDFVFSINGLRVADPYCDDQDDMPESEVDANAHLIAAAPEMLEALQWQEMADADPEASRRKGYYDRARELRRAAIAKAEGK